MSLLDSLDTNFAGGSNDDSDTEELTADEVPLYSMLSIEVVIDVQATDIVCRVFKVMRAIFLVFKEEFMKFGEAIHSVLCHHVP